MSRKRKATEDIYERTVRRSPFDFGVIQSEDAKRQRTEETKHRFPHLARYGDADFETWRPDQYAQERKIAPELKQFYQAQLDAWNEDPDEAGPMAAFLASVAERELPIVDATSRELNQLEAFHNLREGKNIFSRLSSRSVGSGKMDGGASNETMMDIDEDRHRFANFMDGFFGSDWPSFTHQDWLDMIEQIEELFYGPRFRRLPFTKQQEIIVALDLAEKYAKNFEEKQSGSGHYNALLQDPRWVKLRNAAMKRARGKCVMCGHRATEVHHARYKDVAGGDHLAPWMYSLKDLYPVCRACHKEAHAKQYGGCRVC